MKLIYALWEKMQAYFDTSTLNESVKYAVHFWLKHRDRWFLRTEVALSPGCPFINAEGNCW